MDTAFFTNKSIESGLFHTVIMLLTYVSQELIFLLAKEFPALFGIRGHSKNLLFVRPVKQMDSLGKEKICRINRLGYSEMVFFA